MAPRFPSPPPAAPHIPTPPEPWAQDARDAAAKLHVVPAFEARVPERAAFVPAAMACPAARGLHRPRTTRRTWAAVAFLAALLALALIAGAAR